MIQRPGKLIVLLWMFPFLPITIGFVSITLTDLRLASYLGLSIDILMGCWFWGALPFLIALMISLLRQRAIFCPTLLWHRIEVFLRVIWQTAAGLDFFLYGLLFSIDADILP